MSKIQYVGVEPKEVGSFLVRYGYGLYFDHTTGEQGKMWWVVIYHKDTGEQTPIQVSSEAQAKAVADSLFVTLKGF